MRSGERKALSGPVSVTCVTKKSEEEYTGTSSPANDRTLGQTEYNIVPLDLGWLDEPICWPEGETGLKTSYNCKAEIDPLLELVGGNKVCVQAGGALGLFAKYLSRHFETVLTFEPNPILFQALVFNTPEYNIFTMPMALTRHRRSVGLAAEKRHEKSNMGAWWVEGEGKIPGIQLDAIHLEALDLLILDIEGGELAAIAGAERHIEKFHPVLHLEWKKKIHDRAGVTAEEFHEKLLSYGYELVRDKRSERTYV